MNFRAHTLTPVRLQVHVYTYTRGSKVFKGFSATLFCFFAAAADSIVLFFASTFPSVYATKRQNNSLCNFSSGKNNNKGIFPVLFSIVSHRVGHENKPSLSLVGGGKSVTKKRVPTLARSAGVTQALQRTFSLPLL